MRDRYQVRLSGTGDVDAFSGEADDLYWMLDGLSPVDNSTASIESMNMSGGFIEVAVRDDGSLTIRYRESGSTDTHGVDDVDVLAAHQAITACLNRAGGWRQIFDRISGSFHATGSQIDYEPTGLSIANAMLDDVKRRRRRNLPKTIPPTIVWGSRTVTTGDAWYGIPSSGRIVLRVVRADRAHDHGIAISAPGGALTIGSDPSVPETLIWPNARSAEVLVDYTAPGQALQVCNVYMVRGATWERVDRWSENAGMVVEPEGELRTYHCNHAWTAPPGFADLVFSMRLSAG